MVTVRYTVAKDETHCRDLCPRPDTLCNDAQSQKELGKLLEESLLYDFQSNSIDYRLSVVRTQMTPSLIGWISIDYRPFPSFVPDANCVGSVMRPVHTHPVADDVHRSVGETKCAVRVIRPAEDVSITVL